MFVCLSVCLSVAWQPFLPFFLPASELRGILWWIQDFRDIFGLLKPPPPPPPHLKLCFILKNASFISVWYLMGRLNFEAFIRKTFYFSDFYRIFFGCITEAAHPSLSHANMARNNYLLPLNHWGQTYPHLSPLFCVLLKKLKLICLVTLVQIQNAQNSLHNEIWLFLQ
jgi:hypothetical protein